MYYDEQFIHEFEVADLESLEMTLLPENVIPQFFYFPLTFCT